MSRVLGTLGPFGLRLRKTLRATTLVATTTSITTTTRHASSFLQNAPSPPRLPADQQAEFERLQRAAEAALSSHTAIPTAAADASSSPLSTDPRHVSMPSPPGGALQSPTPTTTTTTATAATATAPTTSGAGPGADTRAETAAAAAAIGTPPPAAADGPDAGSLSGGIRRGAPPEFAGDRNPRTGEVGGPKNEPLRWGSAGDWSFNGRVTDF